MCIRDCPISLPRDPDVWEKAFSEMSLSQPNIDIEMPNPYLDQVRCLVMLLPLGTYGRGK